MDIINVLLMEYGIPKIMYSFLITDNLSGHKVVDAEKLFTEKCLEIGMPNDSNDIEEALEYGLYEFSNGLETKAVHLFWSASIK